MTTAEKGLLMLTAAHSYRFGLTALALTVLLLLYGIGALGIVGDGGPADLLYVGVAGVGLVGAAVARFRPRGTALAVAAAAGATLLAGIVVLAGGLADGASTLDVVGLTGMFACLYGVTAWLFHRAAEAGRRTAPRT
jgi:hypothetical protein